MKSEDNQGGSRIQDLFDCSSIKLLTCDIISNTIADTLISMKRYCGHYVHIELLEYCSACPSVIMVISLAKSRYAYRPV